MIYCVSWIIIIIQDPGKAIWKTEVLSEHAQKGILSITPKIYAGFNLSAIYLDKIACQNIFLLIYKSLLDY